MGCLKGDFWGLSLPVCAWDLFTLHNIKPKTEAMTMGCADAIFYPFTAVGRML
jgi:hypothetical protein